MELKEQEKRFGIIALGKGFISLTQLFEAMKIQITEDAEKRKHRLIGQILIEMNALNPSQVIEVIDSVNGA
ncbi:hypothetical protein ACFL0H_05415 [Thermodesulfobacteriota bacterium]